MRKPAETLAEVLEILAPGEISNVAWAQVKRSSNIDGLAYISLKRIKHNLEGVSGLVLIRFKGGAEYAYAASYEIYKKLRTADRAGESVGRLFSEIRAGLEYVKLKRGGE